jgi:MFS family permease
MSGYETVVRAFISDTVPIKSKGKFFGIFNTAFGISLFIGNSFSGYLYKIGIKYIYYFVIITQVVSMFVFILTLKRIKKNT